MAPANLLPSLFFLLPLLSAPLLQIDARAVEFFSFSKASNGNTPPPTTPNTFNSNNYEVAATTTTTTPNTNYNYQGVTTTAPSRYDSTNNYQRTTPADTPSRYFDNNNYQGAATSSKYYDANNYQGTTTPKNYGSNYYEEAATTTTPNYNYNYYQEAAASTTTGNNYRNNPYNEQQQAYKTTSEPGSRTKAYSSEFRPGSTTTSAAASTPSKKYSHSTTTDNNINTESLYGYNSANTNQQKQRSPQGFGMSDTRILENGRYHYKLSKEEQYRANTNTNDVNSVHATAQYNPNGAEYYNPQTYSYKPQASLTKPDTYNYNDQFVEAEETQEFQP